ncbi:auxilin-related protein 1-like isoform X2 [Glycine soja]|uniref:Auxilin-related protein 1 isoform A n=1 Tax=Glycine soja TaxID=3848 RepID=A0A445L531_GLYSO|nr:auxilin-related protein 1-like isoform X2 [Glycine soja]RZC18201.1 Auxilin-related protein 1 isoform A [Glycine soja]
MLKSLTRRNIRKQPTFSTLDPISLHFFSVFLFHPVPFQFHHCIDPFPSNSSMDEFGVLTERFGLKPQGKSAPMARAKRPPNVADSQTRPNSKSPLNGSPSHQNSTFDFDYGFFSSSNNSNTDNKTQRFDDIFGGDAKSNGASFDYDSIFSGSNKPVSASSYVDDIFGGMHEKSVGVDDLLDKIGGLNTNAKSPNTKTPAFDYLIPGFGVSNNGVEMNKPSVTPNKPAAAASQDDPFLIFETASSSASSESFLNALEQISKSNNSKGTKGGSPSLKSPPKPMSKVNRPSVSTIDELEDFAMGGAQTNASSRKANVNAAETKQNLAARMNNGKRVPAARVNQANGVDDLESFFSMGSRSSSVPKSRTPTMDHMYDNQMKNKEKPEVSPRVPSRSSASMNKSPVMTSLDDLSLMFGGSPSSEFQEVEGETEERRKARLGRHQRAQERALKAVNDMNQRDLQTKMEQEERRKIADTADVQIKRWAAGKEGNMRALLSTLQYVLWPECGWQPVSLTDMITSSAVKKVYRKANLCIHPDKVQQKGATLEQKYTAEKVFDILKEAYTKFNAEELS